ncbi:Kelch motif domain protein [hydrothermal vent metagenome]|uniref:Kelch motif domain protein n=1 Tax=hydrothermal vent metagenome TaxID=652676 RepID=A0A3B0RWM9_9ZZZZ
MEVENTVVKKMPMEKFFPAFAILTFATLTLAGCARGPVVDEFASWDGASARIIAALPEPHTNNAVAVVASEDGASFWSFNGLGAGKTYQDVSKAAFVCKLPGGECRAAGDVPVEAGRLASTAIFLGGRIYLFGGYTVAEDGTEISTPEVLAFNPETEEYKRRADMPTPVDDAVAFAFGERYIALVSGWHDDGNVAIVQVLDTVEDIWLDASNYPGAPVFGHAGGAVGNTFVIADGVGVVGEKDGRRQFGAVNEVWLGEIDPDDPTNISWRKLPPHPGVPLYRMAAVGDPEHNRIVFYGGGDNPYNYNGVGYDGVPARASDVLFAFELETDQWIELGRTGRASMDHRGLMIWDGAYWTLGGMNDAGDVVGDLVRIDIVE